MSGGVIDRDEEIVEEGVKALRYSSVEMLDLISHGGPLLESFPLLQHLPDYLRGKDLPLESIGYFQAKRVELLGEADVLA